MEATETIRYFHIPSNNTEGIEASGQGTMIEVSVINPNFRRLSHAIIPKILQESLTIASPMMTALNRLTFSAGDIGLLFSMAAFMILCT